MKPSTIFPGADRSDAVRQCAIALPILAIACLLNACGGGAGEAGTGGGSAATCVTGGPASAVLAWDEVAGATGYRIHYDTAAGTSPQFVNVPDGLTTTITITTGLVSGTTYYFAATALNGSIESNFSNVVCKKIP